jgi:hypothetical protein
MALSLRDRLVLIAGREVDDRILSPGEAEQIVKLIDAVRGIEVWICRPSDVQEFEVEALGRARDELNEALNNFRGWT